MTIKLVGTNHYVESSAGTLSVLISSAAVAGDVGLLHLNQRDTATAVSTPTGWTLIKRQVGNTATHVTHVFYRVLDGSEGGFVDVTVPASTKIQGAVAVFRGVDTTTVQDRAAAGGAFSASLPIAGSTARGFPATPGGDNVTVNAAVVSFAAVQGARSITMDAYGIYENARAGNQFDVPTQIYGGTGAFDSVNSLSISAAWIVVPVVAKTPTIYFLLSSGSAPDSAWVTIALRPASSFASGSADLVALTALPAPRSAGVLMSQSDPYQGKLSVEIASPYTDSGGVWDVSFWDVATWAGYQWNDISSRVRGLTWKRGSEQPGGRPAVGTATVTLDNRDGDASPWSTVAGDFNVGGVSWLRAGILVRFGVNSIDPTTAAESYFPFYTGIIETLQESTSDNVDGWVDLNLAETLSTIAIYESPPVGVLGAGETFATRIARLLADADWRYATDTTLAAAADYSATFQGTTLAGPRLTEVYLTGDSINARILSGSNGELLATPAVPSSSPSYAFSNAPSGADLPMITVVPYVSTDRVLNDISATRVGGITQTVQSSTSIDQFGHITTGLGFPRDDLIVTSDTVVFNVITDVLARTRLDDIGIESFQVDADMDPTTLYAALTDLANAGVDLRKAVTVKWTHPSGQILTIDLLIDAGNHAIVMEGNQAKWTATFSTAALSPRTS